MIIVTVDVPNDFDPDNNDHLKIIRKQIPKRIQHKTEIYSISKVFTNNAGNKRVMIDCIESKDTL